MSKYDFDLDMTRENSNSLILRNIRADSDVLEIACAHGRMTRYLRDQLRCRVTIVEKDLEAGTSAAQFAADSRHIGAERGDLENGRWHDDLQREKKTFDYIIMADILEHLVDPWKVLGQARELLKAAGSIWISVPNITYNGVLIELLNGRFDYRKVGLLDNTHLRFFSARSLEAMANGAGLAVAKKLDPIQWVDQTELKNSYADVPWYVARFLRNRPGGETYQFVWELTGMAPALPA